MKSRVAQLTPIAVSRFRTSYQIRFLALVGENSPHVRTTSTHTRHAQGRFSIIFLMVRTYAISTSWSLTKALDSNNVNRDRCRRALPPTCGARRGTAFASLILQVSGRISLCEQCSRTIDSEVIFPNLEPIGIVCVLRPKNARALEPGFKKQPDQDCQDGMERQKVDPWLNKQRAPILS